ncbi:hypothetical protein A0256_15060 [Mucilaginibacter sp. PAMC 26640]|nr:hypothetical protein A0256_15060 [Mucilaginibacter sp. PAMC 26640]
MQDTDKVFNYSIRPGLDSNRITNYTIVNTKGLIELPWLAKKESLVQFLNKKVLLLNPGAPLQSIPRQLNINYIYVSNNAFWNHDTLATPLFIIDGSNTDRFIEALKNIPGNCKVLKRNKSVTILSN